MARAFPDLKADGGFRASTTLEMHVGAAASAYRKLTGVLPEAADIEGDANFDRHALASILALASTEGGSLAARAGLTEAELAEVFSHCFDGRTIASSSEASTSVVDADEVEIVRTLLIENLSNEGDCGPWLASMMARRAMEPNHLWEDLGLRERSELTRLIARHFAPLALRNDKNMRWKRFIYRMMCEDDGFVMCSTPVCSNCSDYELCYGAETGTSRVASTASPAERAV